MTFGCEELEMTAARRKFTRFPGDGSRWPGVGTLESDSEERGPSDGGRRLRDSRGAACDDGGRRTSRRVGKKSHGDAESRPSVSSDHGERSREGQARRSRGSPGRASEDVGFSRRDSRRVSEELGHRHSDPRAGLRGHRDSLSGDPSSSEAGGHSASDSGAAGVRGERDLRRSGAWDGAPRARGSGQRPHGLGGSWERGSADGSPSLSSSWDGVSEDRGYAASDSSWGTGSEDAGRRLTGSWERRREEEGSRSGADCERPASWGRASEDRRSSRGLDSTPPPSPRSCSMPAEASSGPSAASRETASSCKSHGVVALLL